MNYTIMTICTVIPETSKIKVFNKGNAMGLTH